MDHSDYQDQDQCTDDIQRSRQVTDDQIINQEQQCEENYAELECSNNTSQSQSGLFDYQADDQNLDTRERQETELVNLQQPDQVPIQQTLSIAKPLQQATQQYQQNQKPINNQQPQQQPPQQQQQNNKQQQQPQKSLIQPPQYQQPPYPPQYGQNTQPPPYQQQFAQNQQSQYPPQQNYVQQQQYAQYPPQVYQNNQPPQFVIQQPQIVKEIVQVTNYPQSANGLRDSLQIQCPFCRKVNYTRVEYVQGPTFWCNTILLIIILPILCWIPWITKDCYDVYQYCSNCSKEVGFAKSDQ